MISENRELLQELPLICPASSGIDSSISYQVLQRHVTVMLVVYGKVIIGGNSQTQTQRIGRQ
jgi:hypothetical protein